MENELLALNQQYLGAMRTLDSVCSELHERYKEWTQCKKGCSACCENAGVLEISYAEAATLLQAIFELPTETRQQLIQQIHTDATGLDTPCPMLIDGACAVYNARPAMCRAYGLVLKAGDELATCHLNFKPPKPDDIEVVDLEPLNDVLDDISLKLWQQLYPNSAAQIPLRMSIQAFLRTLLK